MLLGLCSNWLCRTCQDGRGQYCRKKKPVANKFTPVSCQRDSHSLSRCMKNLILKGYAVNFIILPFCLLDRVSSDLSVLWHTVIHIHADFSNKCSLTKFICWDALEYKSQNHLFPETITKACTEIKKSPPHPASFKMTRIYALVLSLSQDHSCDF